MEVLDDARKDAADVFDGFLVVRSETIGEILQVATDVVEVLTGDDVDAAVGNDGQGFVLRCDREEVDVFETGADPILEKRAREID